MAHASLALPARGPGRLRVLCRLWLAAVPALLVRPLAVERWRARPAQREPARAPERRAAFASPLLARKVVHRIVGDDLRSPDPDPRYEGLYIVFWAGGRPVAHRDVLCRDLPLGRAALAAIAAEAAARATRPLPLQPIPAQAASVVVCTRNRTGGLARCLASLAALAHPPREIIVVDNAPSSEATRRVVMRHPGVRYVLEPRAGLGFARNAGVRAAEGEIIAFADDDVAVEPTWLGRLVRALDEPGVLAATGLVLPAELDTQAQLAAERRRGQHAPYEPRLFDTTFLATSRERGVPVWEIGTGASMAFRREAFDRVGGFDEWLEAGRSGRGGDSELWYRLLAGGARIRYEPAAVVHQWRRSPA
jgi:GT2 family glycosyltransferase